MSEKKILFFIFFIVHVSFLFCDDIDLAKNYLKKSYDYYLSNKYSLSEQYLDKSFEFYNKFPEYYYIKNLIIPDVNGKLYIKSVNAKQITVNINNYFLIDKYQMLKHSALIFKKVRNFNESSLAFEKILDDYVNSTEEDYLNYLLVLFDSNNSNLIKKIPGVIYNAKKYHVSLDFDYYLLLYLIKYTKLNYSNFIKNLNVLISNNYSTIKILYLKTMYYNDSKNLEKTLKEYNENLDNFKSDIIFRKKIVYNFLLKSNFLQTKNIITLLNEWNKIGQTDYDTLNIFNIKSIQIIFKKNNELNNTYLKYTGKRIVDKDNDGKWEGYYEFVEGKIINKIIDVNQNGIYEYRITYYDNRYVKEYYLFKNLESYKKYSFNQKDRSLIKVEYYKNDILYKKITFKISKIFIKLKDLGNDLKLIKYFDFVEEWNDIYSLSKYQDSKIIYKNVDTDKNKVFNEKIFYENGKIDTVLKDLNENNKYEIMEKYNNNVLHYVKYNTNEKYNTFDYIEYPKKDYILKYWDYNRDGKFEVKVFENNNIRKHYFDINYDEKYDFAYKMINGNLTSFYKIKDDKEIVINDYNMKKKNEKKYKWNIISQKDIEKLILPDDIIVNDKNLILGYYFYSNKKYYFKDGLINNTKFQYKVDFIDDKLFIFDISK